MAEARVAVRGTALIRRPALPLLLLGLGACTPDPLSLNGPAPSPGEILVLVEHGAQRPVVASRFDPALGATWAQSSEARALELWSYSCAEDLPRKNEGWWESPSCLPAPFRRLGYDRDAKTWSPLAEGSTTPLPLCDPCRRGRLNVQSFQHTLSFVKPEVGAALWIGPGRALFVVQENGPEAPPVDLWYWVVRGEAEPRPLALAGPGPRIGALTRLADGRILAVGDQLWRLQLEPNEEAPERVALSPWPSPSVPLPDMTARLSAVLEGPNGELWLGSSVGALSWLRGGVVQQLLPSRRLQKPFHAVTLDWIGAPERRRLLTVGVGQDVDVLGADGSIEMNTYFVVDLALSQTSSIPRTSSFPLPLNARASLAVEEPGGRRGYVVDREGQLWRVENNGAPAMLLDGQIKGGPFAPLGDGLLIMGSRGGAQLYSPREGKRCDAEQVGRAGQVWGGPEELVAVDFPGNSGAWLTPRLCSAEAED